MTTFNKLTQKTHYSVQNVGPMSQLMANLVLKFPSCCYHSNRGS